MTALIKFGTCFDLYGPLLAGRVFFVAPSFSPCSFGFILTTEFLLFSS